MGFKGTDTLSLDTTYSGPVASGQTIQLALTIPANAKYTVVCGGSANITVGVWLGTPTPGHGELRICGVGRRGCRILAAGAYTVTVAGNTAGDFTLLVRKWSFWDYFTINSYKSTC